MRNDLSLAKPMTKAEVKAFRKLSKDEQKDYLRTRLHDEAEIWLEYFLRSGEHLSSDRLRSNFLLRPPQR